MELAGSARVEARRGELDRSLGERHPAARTRSRRPRRATSSVRRAAGRSSSSVTRVETSRAIRRRSRTSSWGASGSTCRHSTSTRPATSTSRRRQRSTCAWCTSVQSSRAGPTTRFGAGTRGVGNGGQRRLEGPRRARSRAPRRAPTDTHSSSRCTSPQTDISPERPLTRASLVAKDGSRSIRVEPGIVADGATWSDFLTPPRSTESATPTALTEPIMFDDFPAGAELGMEVYAGTQLAWIIESAARRSARAGEAPGAARGPASGARGRVVRWRSAGRVDARAPRRILPPRRHQPRRPLPEVMRADASTVHGARRGARVATAGALSSRSPRRVTAGAVAHRLRRQSLRAGRARKPALRRRLARPSRGQRGGGRDLRLRVQAARRLRRDGRRALRARAASDVAHLGGSVVLAGRLRLALDAPGRSLSGRRESRRRRRDAVAADGACVRRREARGRRARLGRSRAAALARDRACAAGSHRPALAVHERRLGARSLRRSSPRHARRARLGRARRDRVPLARRRIRGARARQRALRRGGVGVRTQDGRLFVGPELSAASAFTGGAKFLGARETPAEWLFGAHYDSCRERARRRGHRRRPRSRLRRAGRARRSRRSSGSRARRRGRATTSARRPSLARRGRASTAAARTGAAKRLRSRS